MSEFMLALSRILNNASDLRRGALCGTLILAFFAVIMAGCSPSRSKYYSDPGAYLVKQLASRRIVMLADFEHSAPLPYHTLTSFLDKWADEVAAGQSNDRNLVLVLEADGRIVHNLDDFIATGNWRPLIDYWLPFNTMEWLEFCDDLRGLTLRIDSLNAGRGASRRIRFCIIGGESSDFLDDPRFLSMSRAQGNRYFVNIRDSLSALNISAFLDSCTDMKAIVFYGTNHLIGSYAYKNVAGELPRSETGGYYLAHYLKQKFGPDSVLTVCQISPYMLSKRISFFHVASDSDIFFPSTEVTSEDVHLAGLSPQDFDGFIVRHELNIPGHPLADVFSKEVIKADIARLIFFERYFPGYKAEEYYNETLSSLQFLTGRDFSTPAQWEGWLRSVRYDGLRRIGSAAFAAQMFAKFYNNPDEQVRYQLYGMGFGLFILRRGTAPQREHWKRWLWPKMVKQMKLNECVGLLWVGTAGEKEEAADYLLKKFGKPLKAPQYYLKVVRKSFFHAYY